MNNSQRKVLREQIQKLESARDLLNEVKDKLAAAGKAIEEVKESEEEKMWNMEDRLSGTERYRKMEEMTDKLGDVVIDIDCVDPDDLCNDISECIMNIERVIAA